MLLADIIVIVHGLIAAFITLGFVAIPLGAWFGCSFVRTRALRIVHFVAVLFVAGETMLGIACPLTVWEDALRGGRPDDVGFIARWVRWALFYDVPLWIFGVIYVAAAVLALLLWQWVPPRRKADYA